MANSGLLPFAKPNSRGLAGKYRHASVLLEKGKVRQAEKLYRDIARRSPRETDALHMLGVIAFRRGDFDRAEYLFGRAIAIDPTNIEALNGCGAARKELNRPEEAIVCYDQVLAIMPNHPQALNNRGAALRALHRVDEAVDCFDRAVAVDSGNVEALSNRGDALRELNRLHDAMSSFDRALAINPHHVIANFNQSQCRLLLGDFARGWAQYEWRWGPRQQIDSVDFRQPHWRGDESIAGRTIVLHAEQGLGDTIQFCRFAELVAERGGRVVLQVQPSLKGLLGDVSGADSVLADGERLPEFDTHCPLLSLPFAFEARRATIPAPKQYLWADDTKVAHWSAVLGTAARPRVGLVWSGSPGHRNDHNRSIALATLKDLFTPVVEFISLQKELRPDDAVLLDERMPLRQFGDDLADFTDTAALVSLMDLVVSVDTSVAHLAGALGKPTWLLLPQVPDWRWLLDGEDTPWYPTMRLFRQAERGDWANVVDRVRVELTRIFGIGP